MTSDGAEIQAGRVLVLAEALDPPLAAEDLGEAVHRRSIEARHLRQLGRRHPAFARGELAKDPKPLLEAAELAHRLTGHARRSGRPRAAPDTARAGSRRCAPLPR